MNRNENLIYPDKPLPTSELIDFVYCNNYNYYAKLYLEDNYQMQIIKKEELDDIVHDMVLEDVLNDVIYDKFIKYED